MVIRCIVGVTMTIDNVPFTSKEKNGQEVVTYRLFLPHRLYLADCWIASLYREQARNWPLREQILLRRDSAGKPTRFP
jgi:hypothetical protein